MSTENCVKTAGYISLFRQNQTLPQKTTAEINLCQSDECNKMAIESQKTVYPLYYESMNPLPYLYIFEQFLGNR